MANRIERKLNKLDGVEATVNFATERAAVDFDSATIEPELLVDAVAAAGYTAKLPRRRTAVPIAAVPTLRGRRGGPRAPRPAPPLIVSAAVSVPIFLLAMIPPLQFDYWQWLSLQLATPVVLWAGWPFHRAAWQNLKHGAATMDTLISLGTLTALGWSVIALFFLGAGEPACGWASS